MREYFIIGHRHDDAYIKDEAGYEATLNSYDSSYDNIWTDYLSEALLFKTNIAAKTFLGILRKDKRTHQFGIEKQIRIIHINLEVCEIIPEIE